jgi:hypothetical protein
MDTITKTTLLNMIKQCEGTALSIHMPTFESGQRAEQNPIRFKNLVNQAESQLSDSGMGKGEVASYLEPVNDLLTDEPFWQQQAQGLSVLMNANSVHILRLPDRVEEIVTIGEHFQITPLIPIVEADGVYFLLAIDQEGPSIFKGSKFTFERIDELDLPESLQEMFDQYYEFHSHLSFHTKTATPNPDMAAQRGGRFFNQAGGDDIDREAEIINFFHRFDQALMEYLGSQNVPLVLAGAGFLHNLYRQANTYPNLLDEGITKKVDQMAEKAIHELSWALVKGKFAKDIEQAVQTFRQLAAKNKDTANKIEEIVPAAFHQRVHTLFAAENAHVWGKFDPQNDQIAKEADPTANNDDLINFAALHTLINGGDVYILPEESMPGISASAAILRY